MSINIWLSFLSYTIFTALSPGPNNILALNAASLENQGQRRNLLLGVYCGFATVIFICGLFSTTLIRIMPNAVDYLKYIGAGYIMWLAYHIAFSKPAEANDNLAAHSFWKGFFLQFVNVKIILWGITAVTSFVIPYYQSPTVILAFIVLLSGIGISAMMVWAVAGSAFNRFLSQYWRVANILMALFLVFNAWSLIIQ